ncbi:hypothetical protein U020_00807 [Staphylococcus aureus COAS6117]|nr:hypothetical protein U020_00807 [Staphylococcus aureus COAS6117]
MKMRLQQAFFNSSQGPQHREIGFPISTDNASWGVAPTKRISKRNSTGNASWGVGPNTEAYDKSAYDNVQVGVVQR